MDTSIPITIHPLGRMPGQPEGHGPASSYVEAFWLPTVGPTATWLWKRLASITAAAGQPVTFDVEDLGRQLGLTGNTASVRKTLARLCRFGLAHQWSLTTFAVELTAPTLRSDQVRHLPYSLQRAHAELEQSVTA